MKFGDFAVYGGKEYRVAYSPDLKDTNIIMLITDDVEELNNGFTSGFFGITKKVRIDELDMAYSVTTLAMYAGYQLQACEEKGDKMLLSTTSTYAYHALNMEQIDRESYYKWVLKVDVKKVWEKKEPLWEFVL